MNLYYSNTENMVNYTSVLTSASNEQYVPSTETPDSTASLMKNNLIIEFNLVSPSQENKEPVKDSNLALVNLQYVVNP